MLNTRTTPQVGMYCFVHAFKCRGYIAAEDDGMYLVRLDSSDLDCWDEFWMLPDEFEIENET